jgi:LysM repeat protein
MKPSVIMVVAVVAVILGAVGLYYGLSASNDLAKIQTSLATVEQRMDTVAGDVGQMDGKVRTLKDQVQNALTTVNNDLTMLQQEIRDLTNKVVQVKSPSKDKAAAGEGKKGEKAAKSANGMYTIKAGDSIGKIAKEFGVSKRAIMEANPTLEADKVKPGKKIRIP